jgi:hypothetical protein
VLFGSTHLFNVRPKEANAINERVDSVTLFRDFRHLFVWLFLGRVDFGEMLLHGEAVVEPVRPHLKLLH